MIIVLKKPVITEKSMALARAGLYTFLVDRKARKPQIMKSVKAMFDVDPVSVKVINSKPKSKLQRSRRGRITVSGYKKALVGLKKGQSIKLFEAPGAETEEATVTTAEGEPVTTVKEKKSLLKGTKVKVERMTEEKKKGESGAK
jgi:large subunit ribosomal protein L23